MADDFTPAPTQTLRQEVVEGPIQSIPDFTPMGGRPSGGGGYQRGGGGVDTQAAARAEELRRNKLIRDVNRQAYELRRELRNELLNKFKDRTLTVQDRRNLQKEFDIKSREISNKRKAVQGDIKSAGATRDIVIEREQTVSVRDVQPDISSFSESGASRDILFTQRPTPRGTFDPRLKSYVEPSEYGGTATIIPATSEELKEIDTMGGLGKYGDIKTGNIMMDFAIKKMEGLKKSENILTADPFEKGKQAASSSIFIKEIVESSTKIEKDTEAINKDIKELDKFTEGKINTQTNQWTGSKDDFESYQRRVDRINKRIGKIDESQRKLSLTTQRFKDIGGSIDAEGYIQEPTIGAGIFFQTQVPISSTADIFRSGGFAAPLVGAISLTSGGTFGAVARKTMDKFNVPSTKTVDAFNVTLPLHGTVQTDLVTGKNVIIPLQGTVQTDLVTGEEIRTRTIEVEEQKGVERIFSPRRVENVAFTVGTIAPFAVPGVFRAWAASSVLETGPKTFATKHPVEASIIVATTALKVGRYAGALRGLTRFERIAGTSKKVPKVTRLEEVTIAAPTTTRAIKGLKGNILSEGGPIINPTAVVPKVKGKVAIDLRKGTGEFLGEVIEARLGKDIISFKRGQTFLKSKIVFGRPTQLYKGVARISKEGKFKEVIQFDDIVRVVETDKKGVGTVRLFKKSTGEVVDERKITAPLLDLKGPKKKKTSLKTDSQSFGKVVTEEVELFKKGRGIFKRAQDKVGGKPLIKDTAPGGPLENIRESFRIDIIEGKKLDTKTGEFFGSSLFRTVDESVKVGPRKIAVERQIGPSRIAKRRRVQQEIVEGLKPERDITMTIISKGGDEKVILRQVSPKVDRKIKIKEDSEIIFGTLDTSSKSFKALSKLEQKKILDFKKEMGKRAKAMAKENRQIARQDAKGTSPLSKFIRDKREALRLKKEKKSLEAKKKARDLDEEGVAPSIYAVSGKGDGPMLISEASTRGQIPPGSQLLRGEIPTRVQVPPVESLTKTIPLKSTLDVSVPDVSKIVTTTSGESSLILGQISPKSLISFQALSTEQINQLDLSLVAVQKTKLAELETAQIFELSPEVAVDTKTKIDTKTKVDTKTKLAIKTEVATQTAQQQLSPSQQQTRLNIQRLQRPRSSSIKKLALGIPIPKKTKLEDLTKKKIKKKSKQGFYGEVKEKGKWIRTNRKPRTKREALALAGNVVDNSTAVQLRLIKAKKKAIRETLKRRIKIEKYRDYSVRAGKRTPLKNEGLIELKKNRIDTRGEKQQLSAGKVLKSKGFKSLTKVKRKSLKKKTKTTRNNMLGGILGGRNQSFF